MLMGSPSSWHTFSTPTVPSSFSVYSAVIHLHVAVNLPSVRMLAVERRDHKGYCIVHEHISSDLVPSAGVGRHVERGIGFGIEAEAAQDGSAFKFLWNRLVNHPQALMDPPIKVRCDD